MADAAYGLVAALGLAVVTDALLAWQQPLRVGGALFLLWLGLTTVRAPVAATTAGRAGGRPGGAAGLGRHFATTLGLTLANPATIVSFVAAFAGIGLAVTAGGGHGRLVFVAGVFAGSALWWLGLSTVAARLRDRLTPAALRWVNRTAGVVLAGFALAWLWAAVRAAAE